MKKLLLSLLAVTFSAYISAENLTASFTTNGSSSLPKTVDKITITPSQGTGSAPGGTNANQYRLYTNNTLTISAAAGYAISKVTSTASSTGYQLSSSTATCQEGTVVDNGITLSVPSQTVTVDFTKEVRFKTITVTYAEASTTAKTEVALSWSTDETSINLGEPFSAPVLSATVDGIDNEEAKNAVIYSSSNEELLKVAADGSMEFVPNIAGKAVITASIPAANADFAATPATFTLTVVDPDNIETSLSSAEFDYIQSAYNEASITDDQLFTYQTVYSCNSNRMCYNTGNKNGGIASGLVVTATNPDYIITSVDIVMTSVSSTASQGLIVYSRETAFDKLTKSVAPVVPEDAIKLNSSVIKESTSIQINANAFAILPSADGTIYVAKYIVHYAKVAPKEIEAPRVFIDEVEVTDFETAVNLDGDKKTVRIQAADESHHIFHKHIPSSADAALFNETAGEDGFTHVEGNSAEVTVDTNGELHIYAQHPDNGLKSRTVVLTFTGDSTGIDEIGVEGEKAGAWFDLQGRRVTAPAKGGVYISRQGSKVVKMAF